MTLKQFEALCEEVTVREAQLLAWKRGEYASNNDRLLNFSGLPTLWANNFILTRYRCCLSRFEKVILICHNITSYQKNSLKYRKNLLIWQKKEMKDKMLPSTVKWYDISGKNRHYFIEAINNHCELRLEHNQIQILAFQLYQVFKDNQISFKNA